MVVLLIALVLSPLAALVTRSFVRLEADRGDRGGVQPGLTTAYYQALLVNTQQSIFYVPPMAAIFNSLRFALAASIIALIVGGLAAYGLRHQTRVTRWLDIVFLLPMGASAVTLGLGLLLAYSRPPFLWATSPWIIPAVHSLAALPFVIRTIQPALSSIPSHLPESAAVLGASPLKVIQFVEWPLIRRAILSSIIFAFTISLGEFGATAFLTRPDFPTIPIAIFRYLSQPGGLNYGQALAMAVILLVVCGTGITLIEKLKLPGSSLM
jgi:thiamine transport system permease protein